MKAKLFILVTLALCNSVHAEFKTETLNVAIFGDKTSVATEQVHHRSGALSRLILPVSADLKK